MPAQRRANITVSDAALRSWHRSGMRLQDIRRKIEETTGWAPDISTISKWLRDMGEEPRHRSRRGLLPWDIRPEHYNGRWRIMLQAAERRLADEELSVSDQKAVDLLDDILFGRGVQQVVGYHPEIGFYRVDATPEEIERGAIIRRPEETGKSASIESLDLNSDDETLAAKAREFGIVPELLENVGRNHAADLLRDLYADPKPALPDAKADKPTSTARRAGTRRRTG